MSLVNVRQSEITFAPKILRDEFGKIVRSRTTVIVDVLPNGDEFSLSMHSEHDVVGDDDVPPIFKP